MRCIILGVIIILFFAHSTHAHRDATVTKYLEPEEGTERMEIPCNSCHEHCLVTKNRVL
jgi:hypothetical protein